MSKKKTNSPKHDLYRRLLKRGWEYSTTSPLGTEIYTYKQKGQREVSIVYYPETDEWDFILAQGKGIRGLFKFLLSDNQY